MNSNLDDAHYKKHVTDTGEVREIVVCRDIYSYGGIKLLSVGARVNSAMYERIVNHKLQHKLEETLSILHPFGIASLLELVKQMLERQPLLARMQLSLKPAQSILKIMGTIYLNDQLAFKLTIAQEKMPALFKHSVESAIICAYLGLKQELEQHQIVQLATAGLFHDLGELHIDPALMDRKQPLTTAQRRHFYIHPLTMYILLKEFREYHPAVSTAVLEHHERLDGSGYPSNLRQDKLGHLGRILAVAELVSSMYRGGENMELMHISTSLKFNMRHQLDAKSTSHMLEILDHEILAEKSSGSRFTMAQLNLTLQKMADMFNAWNNKFMPQLDANCDNEALMFLSLNLHMLRHVLEDSGFNGNFPVQLSDILNENSSEAHELHSLHHEFVWKIRDMINELIRRWPELEQPSNNSGDELVREWIANVQELISTNNEPN